MSKPGIRRAVELINFDAESPVRILASGPIVLTFAVDIVLLMSHICAKAIAVAMQWRDRYAIRRAGESAWVPGDAMRHVLECAGRSPGVWH
ncbi:MAG: hypothetical protein WBV39_06445 [Rudaea sp.]